VTLPMTVMWSACRETDDAAGSPAHSVGQSMVTTYAPLLLDFAGTSGIFATSRICGATVQREGINVPGSTAVRVSTLADALGPLVGTNDALDEASALTFFNTEGQPTSHEAGSQPNIEGNRREVGHTNSSYHTPEVNKCTRP
jgi:hypothetical protein